MNTLKSVLFVALTFCCFAFANSAFASTPDESPNKNLRTEIKSLLKGLDYQSLDDGTNYVDLAFRVNEEGALMLVSSQSNNSYLRQFTNQRLHQQKIDIDNLEANVIYRLRIHYEYK
ncbi:MAG: hypothetical protein AAFP19_01650 [Bacteroidota bacterium]